MWTKITRPQCRREGLRYSSDMTEAEWHLIEPLFPAPAKLGRPRTTDLRLVLNGILYISTTRSQWRLLPKDFPPMSTVQRFFYRWRDDGTLNQINHLLVIHTRERMGREASPSAGVIDSQSVKITEAGGPRGYDAGKCNKGRKRHFLTDTNGCWLARSSMPPISRTETARRPCSPRSARPCPWLRHVFADGGYAEPKLETALARIGTWSLEIIKRSDTAKGFELLPRRWVVERTIAWLNRNRRLAKDFETTIESAVAWILIASIKLLSRRAARA